MSEPIDINAIYGMEGDIFIRLLDIHKRLADESRPLRGGERRDLAHRLGLIVYDNIHKMHLDRSRTPD